MAAPLISLGSILLLFGIGLALARASQGDDPSPLLPLLWAWRELGGGAPGQSRFCDTPEAVG